MRKNRIISHPPRMPLCADLEPRFEIADKSDLSRYVFMREHRDQLLVILGTDGLNLTLADILQKKLYEQNGVVINGQYKGWAARPFIMSAPEQGWMLARPFNTEKAPRFTQKHKLPQFKKTKNDQAAWQEEYQRIKAQIRAHRRAVSFEDLNPEQRLDSAPSLP